MNEATTSLDPEVEAIWKVLAALQPLDAEARFRVTRWVTDKLEIQGFAPKANVTPAVETLIPNTSTQQALSQGTATRKASSWMQANGLTEDEISSVFHVSDEAVEIIIAEMPGNNAKEQSLNAYILTGAAAMIQSGDPSFTDKAAREACVAAGCFKTDNHSAYMRDHGNELVGSKDKGWKLTAPGLKKAALLIKSSAKVG